MPDLSSVYRDIVSHLETDLSAKATGLGLDAVRNIVAARELIRPPACAIEWTEFPFEYWRVRGDGSRIVLEFDLFYHAVYKEEDTAQEKALDMAQALMTSLEEVSVTGIPDDHIKPIGPCRKFTGTLDGEEDLRCITVTMRLRVIW